jgi:DeoR/GlpR family transcriptional regulator of sugar metabolism
MLAIERRIALATLLERNPVLKVEDLARRFDVSTATIRRDFRDLEQRGLITRQYGGAVARSADGLGASPLRQEGAFSARAAEHAAQKEAIACCALEFVTAGSTVIFDASTTVLTLAHLLPLDVELTAIVHSLPVTTELARRAHVTTTILGGTLRHTSLAYGGPIAEATLQRLFADTAFISARGLSPRRGLTEANPAEAALKEIMVANATRVIALIDSSKLGQTAMCLFAPLERISTLVTDDGADPTTIALLRTAGMQVVIAPVGGPESPDAQD